MNHDEALQLMAAEKYFLNELSPETREQFEEHFFECAECANDMRAGTILIQQSKAMFAAESSVRTEAARTPAERRWFGWLRPAFAVPAMAVLLAVIVYQNWALRSAPQVLPAAFVNIGSRGGNVASVSVRQGEGFLLRVSVPPGGGYSSYIAEVYGPTGKLEWSLSLPYTDSESYFIQVPAGRHQEGVYALAIRGLSASGSSSEIGRSAFELSIAK